MMGKRSKFVMPLVLVMLAAACTGSGNDVATPPATAAGADCPTDGEEFETAKLYIEHNATDADTGVHGLFGGEAWSELCLWDPNGDLVMLVDPLEQLDDLGIADFFFESREPENSEFAIEDLQAVFPEGDYRVAGTDFEGTARAGTATFTHDIPVEPTIHTPTLAQDAESAADATIPTTGLVIGWDPVMETLGGDAVSVTGYEVIITNDEFEDPNGLSRPVYDVHVPPNLSSLSVPDEFLESDTIYELEVLVLEESGNQTISLGFFMTES